MEDTVSLLIHQFIAAIQLNQILKDDPENEVAQKQLKMLEESISIVKDNQEKLDHYVIGQC
ncbi:MAG: hypothetical protein ABIA04_08435 [Pseudomonadota bacterium]